MVRSNYFVDTCSLLDTDSNWRSSFSRHFNMNSHKACQIILITFSLLFSSSSKQISTSPNVYARGRELRDVYLFPTLAHATAHFFMRRELEPCGGTRDASATRLLSSHSHHTVCNSPCCCLQISALAMSNRSSVLSDSFPSSLLI